MTIIKTFTEKKPIDGQPLVASADVEAAGGEEEVGPLDPQLLMMRVRAKRASTITTLALIVVCSLVFTIALCGAFFIYKQGHRTYRTVCNVPYLDDDDAIYHEKLTQESSDMDMFNNLMNKVEEMVRETNDNVRPGAKFFPEEVEMDLRSGFEKVIVPEFERGRNSQFVHDFNQNLTAIVDIAGQKCFIMPLNRTLVLPPKGLKDLIEKMASGYYTFNPNQLSEKYRAIPTSDTDYLDLGLHISEACRDFPVYTLEKLQEGVVRKRSAEGTNKAFTVLDGLQPRGIEIVNIEALPYAVAK